AIVEPGSGRSLRLSGISDKGPVIGASVTGDEGLLAWTATGALFDISPSLSARKVADDVALARYAGAQAVVFRWRGSDGKGRITLGSLEASRRPEGPRR